MSGGRDGLWSAVEVIRHAGYALVPGLTHWLDELSPLNQAEAWALLHDEHVQSLLEKSPHQRDQFFLNDDGGIDQTKSVAFAAKAEKSHLTVLENSEWISDLRLLPASVQEYFRRVNSFVRHVRRYLDEAMPRCENPTTVKVRIFRYLSSDLLVDLRQAETRTPLMKTHVDGSVITLVIAESDGRLCCRLAGGDQPIGHKDGRPFAALIPGIAATHDFGLVPTPHCVLPNSEPRVSLTAFLTPILGHTAQAAAAALTRWRARDVA